MNKESKNRGNNLSLKIRKFEIEATDANVYRCSNLNYQLLGYIVESVTNDSFGNVLNKEITQPLSMNSTTGFVTDNFVQGFQYFLYHPIVPISINFHKMEQQKVRMKKYKLQQTIRVIPIAVY